MHAELSREPRAEAPIMSAMHVGVMTTSTEMMYAQHVTLTLVVFSRIQGESQFLIFTSFFN